MKIMIKIDYIHLTNTFIYVSIECEHVIDDEKKPSCYTLFTTMQCNACIFILRVYKLDIPCCVKRTLSHSVLSS